METQNNTQDIGSYYGYNIPIDQFFRCALSVDCVIFGYHEEHVKVLLIERGAEPYKGQWALPGDLMYPYENLHDAAHRVLKSLTGIDSIYMNQAKTFGALDRHPVGRVVTVSYFALVNIDDYNPKASSWAEKLKWHPLCSIPSLAFDHNEILNSAASQLKETLHAKPIGFKLLPDKFTLGDVHRLYERILGTKLDKANFRKKMLSTDFLEPLGEMESNVRHRPAKLYRVASDVLPENGIG